jgi:O-antigen/teichoic acid export membrane protein
LYHLAPGALTRPGAGRSSVTSTLEGDRGKVDVDTPGGGNAGAAVDVAWLVGTGYAAQVATLVVSIALRGVLGPTAMGFVALAQLAVPYAPFLTLGVAQAAEREIAIELGRGRPDLADGIEGIAAILALAVGAAVAIGCLIATRWIGAPEAAVTLAAAGLIVFMQQIAVWATIRLRTRYQFRALGIWGAVGSIAAISLTLLGAVIGGMAWALAGLAAGAAFQAAVLARAAGLTVPRPGTSSLQRLVSLGPGFLAAGLSAVLLNSIDQIAVASLLGPTALGLYTAAYLGNAFLVRVPNLVGSVIYPRLQRDLGAHGDIPRLHGTVRRTTEATLVAMGPLIAVLFIALPVLVRVVLPAFVPAIPAMRLLLIGVAGLALAVPASQLLVTVDRVWRQVAITLSIGLGMTTTYVLASTVGAMSISSAAVVDLVAYSLYGIVVQAVAARVAREHTRWLIRPMGVIALPLAVLMITAVVIDTIVVDPGFGPAAGGALVQAIAFGLTWVVVAGSYLKGQPTLANDLMAVFRAIGQRLRRAG